jgi:quercetin dioxygenase-like cupin family protein
MRDQLKDGRRWARWSLSLAVVATCVWTSSVVSASPPSEGFASTPIGSGETDRQYVFKAVVGKRTVVSQFNFEPGAYSGWHHHYGRTLVTVSTGEVTLYHADCSSHVYVAGDAFVEMPGVVHIAVNTGDEPLQLGTVFFRVPMDAASPRVEDDEPSGCDVTQRA